MAATADDKETEPIIPEIIDAEEFQVSETKTIIMKENHF